MISKLGNMDAEQPEPTPRRHRPAVPPQLYALVALLLGVGCVYLVWLHGEDQMAIQQLEQLMEKANNERAQLNKSTKEVREALTELADHTANEAELHRKQGNRKQALADVQRARYLLSLAIKLTTCNCHKHKMKPIDAKLTKLTQSLHLTKEEVAMLESSGSPSEKEVPQP